MPKMIATKRHTYGRSKVNVGDIFDVSVHDVRLMRAMGWAVPYTVKAMTAENTEALVPVRVQHVVQEEKPLVHVQEEPVAQTEPTDHRQMLVDKAKSLGIYVDGRWSTFRIQREIDEYNRNTYQRRDMVAEDE